MTTTTSASQAAIEQLTAMRSTIATLPAGQHGVTREAAEALLQPLPLRELREVNEHFGFSVWAKRGKAAQVQHVAENVVGCLLTSYAINPGQYR